MGNLAVASEPMRLYRGLKNPYRPELVNVNRSGGTDFTDCPATALLYARSSRGDWRQLLLPAGDYYSCRFDGWFTRGESRWGSCRRGVM